MTTGVALLDCEAPSGGTVTETAVESIGFLMSGIHTEPSLETVEVELSSLIGTAVPEAGTSEKYCSRPLLLLAFQVEAEVPVISTGTFGRTADLLAGTVENPLYLKQYQ